MKGRPSSAFPFRTERPGRVLRAFPAALLALALAAAPAARAEAPAGRIEGVVTLVGGSPAPGVLIRALSLDSGREARTATDARGAYGIRDLAPGAWHVKAGLPGLSEGVRTVEVREGASVEVRFELAPGGVTDDVTVTAEKIARPVSETPQPVTITSAAEIDDRRPMSTLQAVERTPNLIPIETNPARERPRLRGLASNRILILVDGERLNNNRTDAGAAGLSPSLFDVTNLESIEVVGGSGSSLYGTDSIGGTINLRTKEPSRPDSGYELHARLDGQYRSNGDWRRGAAAVEYATPKLAFRLGGSTFKLGEAYDMGSGAVSQEENVAAGSFANGIARSVPGASGIANTWAVYSLADRAPIPNAGGQGFNDQLDLWYFVDGRQSLRFRMVNSQHLDLGSAFSTPPYDPDTRSNAFRRLDKWSLRYEAKELSGLLRNLSVGGYFQKISFPQNDALQSIVSGSSYATNAQRQYVFTGNVSSFTPTSDTITENRVRSKAVDAFAVLKPAGKLTLTVGAQLFQDDSSDKFDRQTFGPTGNVTAAIVAGKSNPDSIYRNLGAFVQAELEAFPWLKLGGGFRLDSWKTEANPSRGFPLGPELANLNAAYPQLAATPADVNVAGVDGIQAVASGSGSLSTSDTPVTGSLSAVVRLPWGIHPYVRWANSFREPSITERYILRDFGSPVYAIVGVPNTTLEPERGSTVDAGVKVQNPGYAFSAGVFRNDLTDFISSVYSNTYFVDPDPSKGMLGSPAFGGKHGVLFFQRANISKARIQGLEATGEVGIPLGRLGSLTPGASLGFLEGTNRTPTQTKISIIRQWYDRDDTLIPLEGSPDDVPLADITPFRGLFSARWASPGQSFFAEYELRYQSRVTRIEPELFSTAAVTQYGTIASLGSITRQSIRAGYSFALMGARLVVTVACENLTDKGYWEQFTQMPAPGRTFVVGITTDFFSR